MSCSSTKPYSGKCPVTRGWNGWDTTQAYSAIFTETWLPPNIPDQARTGWTDLAQSQLQFYYTLSEWRQTSRPSLHQKNHLWSSGYVLNTEQELWISPLVILNCFKRELVHSQGRSLLRPKMLSNYMVGYMCVNVVLEKKDLAYPLTCGWRLSVIQVMVIMCK